MNTEKKLTAMQELKEDVFLTMEKKGSISYNYLIIKIISLLILEKQQIIDAQENGHSYYEEKGIDGEQYYKETFKN